MGVQSALMYLQQTLKELYNIEVQRTDAEAIPERARYNSVMPDYHELKKRKI